MLEEKKQALLSDISKKKDHVNGWVDLCMIERKSTDAHNGLTTLPYFLPHSSAGGSTVWSDAIEQGVKSPPTSVLPAAVGGDG